MLKPRPGLLRRGPGPHTQFIAKHAAVKIRKGLEAIIADAGRVIEKHAFLVRRSEYLLQQSVMLRAQAEELDRERGSQEEMVADLTLRMQKLLDERNARTKKRVKPRKRAKRKGHR